MTAILIVAGLVYLAALLVLVMYLGWRIVAGALFVLVLLSPSPSFAQGGEESALFRVLGYGTYITLGGDAFSTELVYAHGGHDFNPAQRNRGVRIASHVAYPLLLNYATAELYRDGHQKTALWIRVAVVAAFGYATAHNLRAADK